MGNKTYYVLVDIDEYKEGDIIKLPKEEAEYLVNRRIVALYHVADKRGIVKVKEPEKPKKPRKKRKSIKTRKPKK